MSDLADPPSKLVVTGYEEGTTISAGTVLRLMCTATAGNPLATLTWYKNDRKVRETNATACRRSRLRIAVLALIAKICVFQKLFRKGTLLIQ